MLSCSLLRSMSISSVSRLLILGTLLTFLILSLWFMWNSTISLLTTMIAALTALIDTVAWVPWILNFASIAVANVGGTTEITESEDFHIEGNVSVQKTTTKPSEDSVNIQQSNFHFTADIKDGHLSSTVEELKPELPLLNISNSDAVSSAPYYVSAGTSDEPERAPVESNTVDMSLSTSETHLELHRGRPSVDGTKERCNCLPSFPTFSLYDVFRDHHVPAGILPFWRMA